MENHGISAGRNCCERRIRLLTEGGGLSVRREYVRQELARTSTIYDITGEKIAATEPS